MSQYGFYFVTTIGKYIDPYYGANRQRNRTVGYFSSFREAEETILNNDGDIYEFGYYPYAIIEKMPFGLYQHPLEEHWYRWDDDQAKYQKIPDKPFPHFTNFSIG